MFTLIEQWIHYILCKNSLAVQALSFNLLIVIDNEGHIQGLGVG